MPGKRVFLRTNAEKPFSLKMKNCYFPMKNLLLTALSRVFRAGTGPIPMRFFLPRRMAPSKCPANEFFCELTRRTVFPQNEKLLFSTEKLKLTALSCGFRAGTG